MKIYTSYFSNAKTLANAGVEIVGIALFPPKWFGGISLKSLAPTYSIFKFSKSREEYIERYNREVLGRLNARNVYSTIERCSSGKDVALCCFEKPDEFCHRHLLSKWLNNNLGLDIQEFSKGPIKQEKPVKVEAPTLF